MEPMGVAAYNRGSAAISRSLGFDIDDRPKPKSQPRPKDWGSKAMAKATKALDFIRRSAKKRGKTLKDEYGNDVKDLAFDILDWSTGVSKKMAMEVAQKALSEEVGVMDIERVNGVLVKAIGQFQEGEIEAMAATLGERKKHPHADTVQKAGQLDAVDPSIAKILVRSGLDDNAPKDDVVKVSKKSWPAASLKPSQTTMVLDKALGMAMFMLKSGKVGGDLGALVSSDKQIMDGHHRWAATIFASGKKGKVGGFGAQLPGKQLLRLLNILTKGKFNIRGGKPGKGSLAEFTPANVRKKLTAMTQKGISGDFPWSASSVQKVLVDNFGTVEKGIETIAERANLISKKVPGWAPDRKQMPVIEPGQVPQASTSLKKGEVDWKSPYAKVGK
jgi:hypothetical protein